jgi:hypothetical protein
MLALMHVVVVAIGSVHAVSLPTAPTDTRTAPKVVAVALGRTLVQADITVLDGGKFGK